LIRIVNYKAKFDSVSFHFAGEVFLQKNTFRFISCLRASSISSARAALSSKPASHRCCCRSMGQTDGRIDLRSIPFHRRCFAQYAGKVNNANRMYVSLGSTFRNRQVSIRLPSLFRLRVMTRSSTIAHTQHAIMFHVTTNTNGSPQGLSHRRD